MANRIMRPVGIAITIAGYALLAHYTNTMAKNSNLGALTAIAPLAFFALLLAWNSNRRYLLLAALALTSLAAFSQWHAIKQHFGLIYWLQDIGMLLVMLITFGRTLVSGQKPLCVCLAEATHAPLTSRHETYARNVTIAWTLFFASMALTSTLLFFFAPLAIWSVFANFMTLPLISLMFIIEYLLRRHVLPEAQNAHILDALRSFRNAEP